jgi:hypothetical protein
MIVLYWNCRGFANPKTQRSLFNYCKRFAPDFVCIAEPMIDFDMISHRFWASLNLSFVGSNTAVTPSLWVLRKDSIDPPTYLICGDQHVRFSASINGNRHDFSYVYASTSFLIRRNLYADLVSLYSAFSAPWVVIGDFNAVKGAHEKTGRPPLNSSCSDFRACSNDCELFDIP